MRRQGRNTFGVLSINSRREDKHGFRSHGKTHSERARSRQLGGGEFLNMALHGYKVSAVNTGVTMQ